MRRQVRRGGVGEAEVVRTMERRDLSHCHGLPSQAVHLDFHSTTLLTPPCPECNLEWGEIEVDVNMLFAIRYVGNP